MKSYQEFIEEAKTIRQDDVLLEKIVYLKDPSLKHLAKEKINRKDYEKARRSGIEHLVVGGEKDRVNSKKVFATIIRLFPRVARMDIDRDDNVGGDVLYLYDKDNNYLGSVYGDTMSPRIILSTAKPYVKDMNKSFIKYAYDKNGKAIDEDIIINEVRLVFSDTGKALRKEIQKFAKKYNWEWWQGQDVKEALTKNLMTIGKLYDYVPSPKTIDEIRNESTRGEREFKALAKKLGVEPDTQAIYKALVKQNLKKTKKVEKEAKILENQLTKMFGKDFLRSVEYEFYIKTSEKFSSGVDNYSGVISLRLKNFLVDYV